MKVGSLFSGIGGLELGLERAGMEVRWQIEWDDWCTKILEKHWPAVPKYKDIHDVDPEQLEPVDLICGGFPCQPVSLAGARKAQDDDRWLWPQFARIVRVVRPRYVLVENVPGLLTAGFGDVASDLAALGYDFEWESIPAAAVGAPHLRYRIFIVAYPASDLRGTSWDERSVTFDGGSADVADTEGRPEVVNRRAGNDPNGEPAQRQEGHGGFGDNGGEGRERIMADTDRWAPHHQHPVNPTIWGTGPAGTRNGKPRPINDWWAVEPDVGRVANGVPSRVDRLRGLGNAVVPQVAQWVGEQIMAFDQQSEAPISP